MQARPDADRPAAPFFELDGDRDAPERLAGMRDDPRDPFTGDRRLLLLVELLEVHARCRESFDGARLSPDDDSRRNDLGVLVDVLREDALQARRRGNSRGYPKRDGLRDVGSCAVACPLHRIHAQPLEEIGDDPGGDQHHQCVQKCEASLHPPEEAGCSFTLAVVGDR